MENFSTPRAALLPRVANLATLAVLVTATWWSSVQRPLDQAALAGTQASTPVSTQVGNSRAAQPVRPAAAELSAINTSTVWPAAAATLPREGLQAVGYQPLPKR